MDQNESARTMLARHAEENGWTDATVLLLIADWLDQHPGMQRDLSAFLNDTADTEREASAEEAADDE